MKRMVVLATAVLLAFSMFSCGKKEQEDVGKVEDWRTSGAIFHSDRLTLNGKNQVVHFCVNDTSLELYFDTAEPEYFTSLPFPYLVDDAVHKVQHISVDDYNGDDIPDVMTVIEEPDGESLALLWIYTDETGFRFDEVNSQYDKPVSDIPEEE